MYIFLFYFKKSALQGWELVDVLNQSQDASHTKPAYRIKLYQDKLWKAERERAVQVISEALTLLVKPASPTPSNEHVVNKVTP